MYQPGRTDRGIRIFLVLNGETTDICGAVNEAVAWATCDKLNRFRNLPVDRENFWKRDHQKKV